MLMCRNETSCENGASSSTNHPAFRDWLRKEARKSGVSVAELVRTRCQGIANEEERVVAELAAQLGNEVRRGQSSLRSSLADAEGLLKELRKNRTRRRVARNA